MCWYLTSVGDKYICPPSNTALQCEWITIVNHFVVISDAILASDATGLKYAICSSATHNCARARINCRIPQTLDYVQSHPIGVGSRLFIVRYDRSQYRLIYYTQAYNTIRRSLYTPLCTPMKASCDAFWRQCVDIFISDAQSTHIVRIDKSH